MRFPCNGRATPGTDPYNEPARGSSPGCLSRRANTFVWVTSSFVTRLSTRAARKAEHRIVARKRPHPRIRRRLHLPDRQNAALYAAVRALAQVLPSPGASSLPSSPSRVSASRPSARTTASPSKQPLSPMLGPKARYRAPPEERPRALPPSHLPRPDATPRMAPHPIALCARTPP